MIQQGPRSDPFKEQLRESLQRETFYSRTVKIARWRLGAIVGRAATLFKTVQY